MSKNLNKQWKLYCLKICLSQISEKNESGILQDKCLFSAINGCLYPTCGVCHRKLYILDGIYIYLLSVIYLSNQQVIDNINLCLYLINHVQLFYEGVVFHVPWTNGVTQFMPLLYSSTAWRFLLLSENLIRKILVKHNNEINL